MIALNGMVSEFHQAAGIPGPHDTPDLRWKLIREEALEVRDAILEANRLHIAAELADLVYVAYGAALCFDINLDVAIKEIHAANMRKVGPDGTVRRGDDGKILKPAGWRPASLSRALTAKAPPGMIDWVTIDQPAYWKIQPGGRREFDDRVDAEATLAQLDPALDLQIVAYNVNGKVVQE